MASIDNMVYNSGARSTIRHMCSLISTVSDGYSPKLKFFPSSTPEMERNLNIHVEKQIPCLEEFFENTDAECDSEGDFWDELEDQVEVQDKLDDEETATLSEVGEVLEIQVENHDEKFEDKLGLSWAKLSTKLAS